MSSEVTISDEMSSSSRSNSLSRSAQSYLVTDNASAILANGSFSEIDLAASAVQAATTTPVTSVTATPATSAMSATAAMSTVKRTF